MKIDVLGVQVDKVTMKEAVGKLLSFLKTGELDMVFTPNPEIIMIAKDDKELFHILNKASLVVPDGIGVVIASKIMKNPLPERVAGYDLVHNLFKKVHNTSSQPITFYFLGSAPGVAEMAKRNMERKYPGLQIVGVHDGYFNKEEESSVVQEINQLKPDVLLVALGVPKQEKFIYEYRDHLGVKIAIGVGGTLDGMAGKVKRAPVIFQKLGLEWFYRLICQPTRAKRMLKLPLFLIEVMKKNK